MARGQRKRRGVFWLRSGRLPGTLRDDESGLVQGRDVPAVKREQALASRRQGRRTRVERSEDAQLRALGVPVFDRNGGLSELGSYLSPRR
jgi:hypothetical protein